MRILEFILASLLIEITPGPNMSYLATVAMSRGWRIAAKAVMGIAFGIFTVGLLVALGLTKFLDHYPVIEVVLGWSGILFMAGLAVEAWFNAGRTVETSPNEELVSFWRGFITNLLNPKLIIFYFTVLPDFLDRAGDNKLIQVLTLVVVYTMVATFVHFGIIAMASQIQKAAFVNSNRKSFGRLMSVLLLAVAVWLWYDLQN